MKTIANILGALAIFAGMALAFLAFSEMNILFSSQASSASAIQITQVYSGATFYAVMSVSAFLFAIAVMMGSVIASIAENTEAVKFFSNKQN